jgi:hypothetical protein
MGILTTLGQLNAQDSAHQLELLPGDPSNSPDLQMMLSINSIHDQPGNDMRNANYQH